MYHAGRAGGQIGRQSGGGDPDVNASTRCSGIFFTVANLPALGSFCIPPALHSAQEARSLSERLELAEQFTEGRPQVYGSLAWVLGRFRDVALSVRWRVVICRTAPQPKKCCSSASRTASNGCRNWGSLTGSFRRLARESWLGHLAKAVTTHDVQGSRVGHSFLVAAKLCKRLRGYERRNSELAEQLNGKRKDGVRRHARHSS